jgi:hypothetical protein
MIRTLSRTILAVTLCWALQACSDDKDGDIDSGAPTLSAGTPAVAAIDTVTGGPANLEVVDVVSATLIFR